MKMITSRTNQTVKFIRSLKDKKNRDEAGLYIVEGAKMVKEALNFNVGVQTVILTPKTADIFADLACETFVVSEDVFKSMSDEVTPQGVMALVKKPILDIVSPKNTCMFLDGVKDPSNVGAIIRTACACGIEEIYLADGADAYAPKSVRASMSGIFGVKVFSGTREELLNVIDCPLVIADMKGENVFTTNLSGKICIVVGSEAHGVSQEIKDKAQYVVSIPMTDRIESLNAAVSAGIIMYCLNKPKI